MRFSILVFAFSFSSCSAAPDLTPDETQHALRSLVDGYAEKSAVHYPVLNDLALHALLEKHPHTIALVKQDRTAPVPAPPTLSSGQLRPGVGWLRPSSLVPGGIAAAQTALDSMAKNGVKRLILDLRGPASDEPLTNVPAWAGLFVKEGTEIFSQGTAHKSTGALVWKSGDLLVLIDEHTNNACETLAAVLQHSGHALLMGSPTRGRMADFKTIPLRTIGKESLSLIMATMAASIGSVPHRLGTPLVPDVQIPAHIGTLAKEVTLPTDGTVIPAINESELPRTNEASLVADSNPEISWRAAPLPAPQALDRPLQTAVDLLTARAIMETLQPTK